MIEVHAERHKELWWKFGRYQDKDAWQALSGIISKKDIILEAQRRGGRKGGAKNSREHLKRISVLGGKSKKGIVHTSEAKEKMSKVKLGEKNNFFGKHHTEKTKFAMSTSQKNVNRTGTNNPNYGKPRSQEVRDKIAASMKKRNLNGK